MKETIYEVIMKDSPMSSATPGQREKLQGLGTRLDYGVLIEVSESPRKTVFIPWHNVLAVVCEERTDCPQYFTGFSEKDSERERIPARWGYGR